MESRLFLNRESIFSLFRTCRHSITPAVTQLVKVVTILCLQLFISCNSIQSSMRSVSGHIVSIPDSCTIVYGNSAVPMLSSPVHPVFLVYMDSSECSSCLIPKLHRYDDLYAESIRTQQFTLCIIISPKKHFCRQIVPYILSQSFQFPVFIDKEYRFYDLNPHIPTDERFHYLLTNSEGFPIFVGDPLRSDRLMQLFRSAVGY